MPAGLKLQSNPIALLFFSSVVLLSACSRDNPLSVPGKYIEEPKAYCIDNGPYSEYTLLDSIEVSNVISSMPENYPLGYDGVTLNLESSFLIDNSKITPIQISDYKAIPVVDDGVIVVGEEETVDTLVVLNKVIDSDVLAEMSDEEIASFAEYEPQVSNLSIIVSYQQGKEELTQTIDDEVSSITAGLAFTKNYVSTKVNATIKVPRSFKDCRNPLTAKEVESKDFKEDDRYKEISVTQEFNIEIERNNLSSFTENELTSLASLSENDKFGRVLAMNDEFLIIGSANEDSSGRGIFSAADFLDSYNHNEDMQDSGAVYVFEKGGINTWNFHSFIKASNSESGDQFGADVALNNENKLIISAPGEDSNSSGVYLSSYVEANNAKVNNMAASSGAVYVFEFNEVEGAWFETHYIKPQANQISDGNYNKGFGSQLAVYGNTILISAPLEDSDNGSFSDSTYPDSGAVYVYKYSTDHGGLAYVRPLKAFNPSKNDKFGSAIAISDKFIVVGAPFEDNDTITVYNGVNDLDAKTITRLNNNNRVDSGAVYVFDYSQSSDVISLNAFLKSSNSDSRDYFGGSVAISGSNLLVGSIGEDGSGKGLNRDKDKNDLTDSGAVYLFKHDQLGSSWAEKTYIKANDTQANASFGKFLAMERDNIFISAPLYNSENHINAGKTYYYTFEDGELVQDIAFQRVGMSDELRIGSELAIFGRNFAIGASGYINKETGTDQPFVGKVFTYE